MTIHDPAHAFIPYPAVPVPNAGTGPLCGLSFAVKDLYDVAGYPTSGGSPVLLAMSGVKTTTAPSVQKLLDAGARFVGKTITDELAFSMNGNNAHFGMPINGGAPDRIPGGSSSGSAAAVSNRSCDFALGSDTGGSVRAPANHCGLVGMRPTHGAISLQGVLDLAPSFDTCGWFAPDMQVFSRVAEVLLPMDGNVAPERPRLLWPADLWALCAQGTEAALKPATDAAQALWGKAEPVTTTLDSLDDMYWHFRHLQGREAWRVDGAFIERYAPPLGPGVADRFAWSRQVTDAQVAAGQAFRERFKAHMDELLGVDGVLLMPTMPDIAPLRTDPEAALEDYRNRAIRMLCVSGLAGLPQITVPLGRKQGAPLGVSLLGPRGSDRSLVRLARAWVAEAERPGSPTR